MLSTEKSESIEGVQVFSDDQNPLQYYLLPNYVTWQIRPDGKPNFSFVRYRLPIDRPDGKRGGGFAFFQVELAITAAAQEKIRAVLEERLRQRGMIRAGQGATIQLNRPNFTRGAVDVICLDNAGIMVERVRAPTAPSLYGTNAVAVSVELTPEGTALFETFMKGGAASSVIVNYKLFFAGRMPPGHIRGTWNASAFGTFSQEMHDDTHWLREDNYEERIDDVISKSDTELVEWISKPPPSEGTDATAYQKALDAIEATVRAQLAEGIRRNLLEAIPPVDRDISKLRDQGFDNVVRKINTTRISSVTVEYKDRRIIELPANPPGLLEAIGGMKIGNTVLKWEDFAQEADLDHPFFKALSLSVQVNIDFVDLPVFSVDVVVEYKGPQGPKVTKPYTFTKPEQIERFQAFLDGGEGEVSYSYTVNYRGEANVFRSGPHKTKSNLSINVGDLGVWKLDLIAGDINFAQVREAQVSVIYDDGAGVRIAKQFTLTDKEREHKIREVIFKTRDKPARYAVKYFMQDGGEIEVEEKPAEGEQCYVNDPFQARTVSVRTRGDFEKVVETIFVDLLYEDPPRAFRQGKSLAFSKDGERFADWTFPVIGDGNGKLSYTGNILFRTGEAQPIAEPEVKGSTLLIGPDMLEVRIEPDLLDWAKVRLATVTLRYEDRDNGIAHNDTITLRKDSGPQVWSVGIKDKSRLSYDMTAKYFMQDGGRKEVTVEDGSDEVLILEAPAA